jgi:HK97 family phage major capsid protein
MTYIDEAELDPEARADIERRRAALARKARNPRNIERGDAGGDRIDPLHDWRSPRESARRAIDAAQREGEINSHAADKLDRLVRRDRLGADAAYVAAVSDPAYATAFGKLVSLGAAGRSELAQLHLTDAEREAFHRVTIAAGPLNIGTGSEGGFAVPISLDPTVMASGDGTVNPWRAIARVITIVGSNTWKGVSSDGVEAAYEAELTEVADDAPVLAQPSITAEKAQAFCSYSIEVEQDWGGLRDELLLMLSDARERKEAEKFLAGAGHASNEPEGILTGVGAGSTVTTATSATLALDDVYACKQALPPRFQPRARWLLSPSIFDYIGRLVGLADPAEPAIVDDAGNLLRRPVTEVPDMATAVAANAKVAIYGDLRAAFAIVDRVGASIELLPMMVGTNRRPTGQRGLYFYWRNSSGVLVENAVRILKVKS